MNYQKWLRIGAVCIAAAAVAAAALVWYRYQVSHRFVFIPKDIQVTIPEGTNAADIDRILAEAGITDRGAFLKAIYSGKNKEGTLFPDTYRFDPNTSPEEIAQKMTSTFEFRTQELFSFLGTYEFVLNTASILEKEVRTDRDMRLVAGIIARRMSIGMPLQIDATVAYGACVRQFKLGKYCDVTQVNIVDNIKRDSAYNTYTRKGLPAGPISNPGLRALRATLNPEPSEYLYYLSARDGTTIFSRTLEEHNRARAKYLK